MVQWIVLLPYNKKRIRSVLSLCLYAFPLAAPVLLHVLRHAVISSGGASCPLLNESDPRYNNQDNAATNEYKMNE